MKSARLPASRLPTSPSRPSTNAGLYVAIEMASAGERRRGEVERWEPEARARQQDAEDTRSSHPVDSLRANFLEMVGGRRAYFRRQDGPTRIGELFSVHPRLQSSPLPGPQDSFRFFP